MLCFSLVVGAVWALLSYTITWLKMVSYMQVNYWCRTGQEDVKKLSEMHKHSVSYPHAHPPTCTPTHHIHTHTHPHTPTHPPTHTHTQHVCVLCHPVSLLSVQEKEELKKDRVWYPNNLKFSGEDTGIGSQWCVDCVEDHCNEWLMTETGSVTTMDVAEVR